MNEVLIGFLAATGGAIVAWLWRGSLTRAAFALMEQQLGDRAGGTQCVQSYSLEATPPDAGGAVVNDELGFEQGQPERRSGSGQPGVEYREPEIGVAPARRLDHFRRSEMDAVVPPQLITRAEFARPAQALKQRPVLPRFGQPREVTITSSPVATRRRYSDNLLFSSRTEISMARAQCDYMLHCSHDHAAFARRQRRASESRVLVSARRLRDLKAGAEDVEIETIEPVERTARALQEVELLPGADPS